MKVHRNFKATIGDRIVFRSSAARVYLSVSSTHSAIPVFHMHVRGQVTCTETGADKTKALRAQVKARVGEPAVLNAIESRSRDGMRVGLSPECHRLG